MPDVMTYTGTLAIEECCNCHITFAMPEDLKRRCIEDGANATFYCPLGHAQHYTRSEVQKLRDKLADEKWRREAAQASAEAAQASARAAIDQADAAERSARAYKGAATRIRRRVANGVCPCCNRTFADLARHMAGQHPGFEAGQ